MASCRISNTDAKSSNRIWSSLTAFGFRFVVEHRPYEDRKPIDIVRILGGLREHLRFFHTVDPAIMRKRGYRGPRCQERCQAQGHVHRAVARRHAALRHHDRHRGLHRQRRRQSQLLRAPMRTPTWICRRASISKPRFSTRPMRRGCSSRSSRNAAYVVKPIAHRRQHRSLSADRARAARDALAARGARAHASSA